ncbi:MAG TPA: TniQ family protein [Streptosporangiaceae bacterium]|nr:TniQ family protein [Streptosporangiaceae bacterium]
MGALSPLPRSLDPLPEESLPGYLLRLAHRLGLSPIRIVQLTGLTTGTGGPRALMLHLDATAAGALARTARLTAAEVASLCISSMSGRYPQAAPVVTAGQAGIRPVASPWLFTTTTRYCPRCLAGDSSPIQDQCGGAWRKAWRLPVVFACPVHRRLLEHLCPSCGQPAMSAASLIPYSRVSGLHPVQCRAALSTSQGGRAILCAARLDLDPRPPAAAQLPASDLDMLHAVSNHMQDLLQPGGPANPISAGRPATPAQYFADLQLTSGLISAAWPGTRPLFPAQALADAFGEHAESRNAHPSYRVYDTPPLDTLACAALITAAAGILDSPDLRLLGPHLAPGRDPGGASKDSPRWRWIRRYRRTRHECSSGFRDALEPLIPAFQRVGQHRHGRRAPAPDTTFGPEHIPEHLQDDWFRQHFRNIDGIRPRLLRRAAAVRLVQMTAGGSLAEAAAYLGIDRRYIAASSGNAFAAAAYWSPGTGPAEFHLAVHALTRQLSATPGLINYKHRRDALQDWCIDPATWQDIISQLPPTKGPFQPELSDCKRQFATEAVWVRITQGEHVLAPRIIEHEVTSGDPTWRKRRDNMWHFYNASPPKPHYAALKAILNAYADNLAAAIDRHSPDRAV